MDPQFATHEITNWAVLGLLFCLMLCILMLDQRLRLALRRVEHKLDALLKHQGLELPCSMSPEVQRLACNPRQKIAAIKLHRQQTGLSLAEAKAEVEKFGG